MGCGAVGESDVSAALSEGRQLSCRQLRAQRPGTTTALSALRTKFPPSTHTHTGSRSSNRDYFVRHTWSQTKLNLRVNFGPTARSEENKLIMSIEGFDRANGIVRRNMS